MNEGAGDLDSAAFSKALQDKAISLGGSADGDAFFLSLTTLSANKAEAFRLMQMAVQSPRFDQEAIDRMKAQILAYQKQLDEDPNSIAGRTFAEHAFPGHPYGRRTIGTAESIGALTRDDLTGFMANALGRDQLKVVVVGDIGADELAPLLDTLFGAVPATRAAADVADITMQNQGKLEIVDHDIPQSVVVFGAPGLPIKDKDYRPAQVMNYVLGGGSFSSRLMDEVRSKRGLAYGISTGLASYRKSDLISGGVGTDNARVKETIEITKVEIAKMRDAGISDAELADAKAFLTGSYPLRFDSNSKIANNLLGLAMQGFDKDYINRRNAEIMAVTKEQVAEVAKRLLDPAKFYWVVVGKPEGVTPQ
jgi:zinc protease